MGRLSSHAVSGLLQARVDGFSFSAAITEEDRSRFPRRLIVTQAEKLCLHLVLSGEIYYFLEIVDCTDGYCSDDHHLYELGQNFVVSIHCSVFRKKMQTPQTRLIHSITRSYCEDPVLVLPYLVELDSVG